MKAIVSEAQVKVQEQGVRITGMIGIFTEVCPRKARKATGKNHESQSPIILFGPVCEVSLRSIGKPVSLAFGPAHVWKNGSVQP